MKRTIEFGFDEPINGSIAVRITVGTLNLGELGEHAVLRQAFDDWVTKKAGMHPMDMSKEEFRAMEPRIKTQYNSSQPWAYMQPSTRQIEMIAEGAKIAEKNWVVSCLKELGWDSMDGRDTIPADLFTLWDEKSQVVNPRVFGPLVEDTITGEPTEKKVGVIRIG